MLYHIYSPFYSCIAEISVYVNNSFQFDGKGVLRRYGFLDCTLDINELDTEMIKSVI